VLHGRVRLGSAGRGTAWPGEEWQRAARFDKARGRSMVERTVISRGSTPPALAHGVVRQGSVSARRGKARGLGEWHTPRFESGAPTRGAAWLGLVGSAMPRHGWERQDKAWLGPAGYGTAELGPAGLGWVRLGREHPPQTFRAGLGAVRRGLAMPGRARQGHHTRDVQGAARLGPAGPGWARHDMARQGKARQGVAVMVVGRVRLPATARMAWLGGARIGMARRGLAGNHREGTDDTIHSIT
jgi:hypothetical protein